jgi:hypothetical protein
VLGRLSPTGLSGQEGRIVTAQRVLCPTSATWHGKHYVTDRRWRIVAPDDRETVLCSAACALSWLVYGLPADVEACKSVTSTEAA